MVNPMPRRRGNIGQHRLPLYCPKGHIVGLQIGDMIILNFGSIGMTPDQRAAGIVRSRRLAIACMAAALACFMATLYFWDNAYRQLDVSSLKPAATEPEK